MRQKRHTHGHQDIADTAGSLQLIPGNIPLGLAKRHHQL
jgi:hypothetical protein